MGFVHLRVHSAYSLSEGAIKLETLPGLAVQAGMPAVALTDTNNLFGALEFSSACVKAGVQPILGIELAVARETGEAATPCTDPVVLLAKDDTGLANLMRLASRAHLDPAPGAPPHVPLATLADHAEGLILLTGGTRGPLARLLLDGQENAARRWLERLAQRFGDRLCVELHRHGVAEERLVEPAMLALADALGLPIVATNDCFFAAPAMHEAHDALLCIADRRLLSEEDRRRVTPEHWFKDEAAMRAAFADLPEACDNTLALARRCAVMARPRSPLLPVSPKVPPGRSEAETVRAMAEAGLARRLAALGLDESEAAPYRERLDYELSVIETMGFAGYFLIVADFIQWAKAQGIPVGPGRGSGAGSVAAWALAITDLDPLRFGLLFERFLNPERVSMPDFDIDFCQDRRDEVIAYVRREYGADRVAQIITFGKLQARAVVRDVGRVLGLPFGLVNKIAELIPNNPARPVTLAQAIEGDPMLRAMIDQDEQVARLVEIALQLEGLYRHASTHAAGIVIGDRPLIDLIPLYRDPRSDMLVTQYSMKHVEQAGLVKFDFLGLTTLTILRRAQDLLRGLGIEVDLDRLPLDDARTFAMLQRGDAAGVFQFESQGMRDVLRQMRPDRFEDLIAAVALYRPGPMANIPAYCARKHGEPWEAPHQAIRDILAETYGIMVYQEQVMQIAQVLAGYSLGGADLLRRAMGKKIRAEMEKQRAIFTEGAIARGIEPAKAAEIFDLMARFADYGFNKSHAAAYALVAYQTAWVKANHPVAFLAASMSLAIANTDKLASLKAEAERMGIEVLPPDVNASDADFQIERGADGTLRIRYALAAVKKVGLAAMQGVVEERRRGGPFRSIADFAARIDPRHVNRLQIEYLARAGAFDSLEPNRRRVAEGAEAIVRRAAAAAEDRASHQIGLFGGNGPEPLRLPDVPDWPIMERLAHEGEAVGFHLTRHPLDAYAGALRRLGVVRSSAIEARVAQGAGRLRLAGSVVAAKERPTRSGAKMCWLRLSDAAGSYEVTLFSEVLNRVRPLLAAGERLLVTADARAEGETIRLTAVDVERLDPAVAAAGTGLKAWLEDTAAIAPIRAMLTQAGRGKGRVILAPRLPTGQEIEVALPGGFAISPALVPAIAALPGVVRVEEL
ncbi:DNA polymerase III subunit alpha [Elioraea sp.]|uniref:DNA polymerase III subunit alpha n=1 Tax=Elioraea sp. TaxID=2185103 RepID=UPI0021DCBBD9|nr:DNA polymerase III subunit alpha [Elioraea sp.]GIX11678.1 MAG: DNA-directed DNA polymerase [Elioraea sp.]